MSSNRYQSPLHGGEKAGAAGQEPSAVRPKRQDSEFDKIGLRCCISAIAVVYSLIAAEWFLISPKWWSDDIRAAITESIGLTAFFIGPPAALVALYLVLNRRFSLKVFGLLIVILLGLIAPFLVPPAATA